MLYRPWQISEQQKEKTRALAAALQVPPLVCDVLLARGETEQSARALLGEASPLSSPLLLQGMQKAKDRILAAVDKGERITIFGDYDVDGVTATALLFMYLDSIGADVYYKLPSRDEDGYGLSDATVDLLASKGVTLIITVDSGVSANGPIAHAKELGVDVVVTDHHLPPETLPDAYAIVDPQLPGDESPCKALCGAGVALKLAAALDGVSTEEMLPYYADLVAIGTVADIMKLEGENRTIVRKGLQMLQQPEREGIAALLRVSGMDTKEVTADSISYGIAPRLNAAGRMDSANEALELLLCEDEEEATAIAESLNEKNLARQTAEQEISNDILAQIEADPTYKDDRVLVVWGKDYHAGVIGIVASRLVEKYGKPAIVVSIDEHDEGKGSGRSLGNISLYDALDACNGLLLRFGGHELAAGMSIAAEKLPEFRRAINAWVREKYPVLQLPPLAIDAEVQLATLTTQDVDSVKLLAPFGCGNPAPLFMLRGAVVEGIYSLSEGRHTRVRLRQGTGTLYAVLFGTAPESFCYPVGSAVDAAVYLSVYEGKMGPMLSGRIKDVRPAGLENDFITGVQLYEKLQGGAVLSAQEKQALLPGRENTVAVYRAVQKGLPAADLRPLFAQLGGKDAGKTLVSLQALAQLALVQHTEKNGVPQYSAVQNAPKQDLSSAAVLRSLGE